MSAKKIAVGAPFDRRASDPLPIPSEVDLRRIDWQHAFWVILYHALALLAFSPWFFSWTGVVVCIVSTVWFSLFGICIGYHRLLSHRSFICPKWFERYLAVVGVCCVQDTPARWVAVHRWHHQHSDTQPDPHSPLVTFLWSHLGWVFFENKELARLKIYEHYAKDILRDRFYLWIERNAGHATIIFVSWAAFFSGGFLAGLLIGSTMADALQLGASILVWGVFVRTVLVWHQTWAGNSVTHLWGYRNHQTNEHSRNNIWLAIVTHGEGWHNNHHADPRSVSLWHRWWEVDFTYLVIRCLAKVGLARSLVMPNPYLTEIAAPAAASSDNSPAA
jgi:stearoyl-CoA desaturase (delta-9 desaturase)